MMIFIRDEGLSAIVVATMQNYACGYGCCGGGGVTSKCKRKILQFN